MARKARSGLTYAMIEIDRTMTYTPDIHHRRSIRLKDYDYSRSGAYFVTVCAKERACLFGNLTKGQLQINQPGQMIMRWWSELPRKFSGVEIDEFVIMPNHLHGIIRIVGVENNGQPGVVGADRCVCPDINNKDPEAGEHTGSPLHRMVQWFKTMTTNEYIRGIHEREWERFNGKLWQRNYYEHVIRDDLELHVIREYIRYNPLKWEEDDENPNMKRAI